MDAKIISGRAAERAAAVQVLGEARRRSGLSQRDFARLAGISAQYLSAVEHGKLTPSARAWGRISAVIAEHGGADTIRSPEEIAHLALYRQLSPQGRRALDTTAAALVAAEAKTTS
jgi:DNA-binding XRE family transcriptional regulator